MTENERPSLGRSPEWLPKWLEDQACEARAEGRDREVFSAPDGTWTVWMWYGEMEPVFGLPTLEMAERVAEAMHEAFRLGGEAEDYFYD